MVISQIDCNGNRCPAPFATAEGQRVLMVAFHYPPALASGTRRTLSFSCDLPEFGWEPILLTAHPRAHERRDPDQLAEIPPDIRVTRAFALDAARHLAFRRRYSRLTAWPDRWASWWLGAVPAGLYLIRRYRPRVLWTTYPIPTALGIGLTLARLSGLPWVIDLRDPLVTSQHPPPELRESYLRLERKAVERCTRIVVSTPGLQRFLAARYPHVPPEKWTVLPNGFDERIFRALVSPARVGRPNPEPLTLVHGGTLYIGDNERNPAPFLRALAALRDRGEVGPPHANSPRCIGLTVILRATSQDQAIDAMIRKYDLTGMVVTAPAIPYRESIRESGAVDGLLLFQGEAYNHLIPAKLFEYLRACRPIFAMTGAEGDSARILRETGLEPAAALEDAAAIQPALLQFLQRIRAGQAPLPDAAAVANYSRRLQAKKLATLFEEVTTPTMAFPL
ncbi:MAG: glycosyltransferase [Magnetococcales bacterium]|nr:glycosyltransferase [Magnetococcales bacterium]